MEAAFISFLINKLGGIAVDQAQIGCSQLLLQCTTPPLDQIHESVKGITNEFNSMQAFLQGSNWSTAVATDKAFEAWIDQVREASFEIEDIVDEYLYLVGRQRESSITWKNCLMAPSDFCWHLPKAWRGIDSQLQKMQRKLSQLSSRQGQYSLTKSGNQDRANNSESVVDHYRVCDPMLIDEDDVVGIEENKSKLLSWLTHNTADTCRKMTEIAVWGMGGLGKTTLVANVYRNNAVKSHFDCQVWVTVSQTYSVEELLRKMIQKIEGKMEHINNMSRVELFDILKESLQQKRYIVVLDDVWDDKMRDQMSHAFIDSDNGSRLVVTTRNHEVARIANDEHIIELQQLNEEDAWILFCKKAFRRENNNECPQVLEDYARMILNKCGGSPLAISVIGSLLSTKEKSESGWQGVYDRLHWEFEKNPSLDTLKSILNLSFNDLPNYLKNCFVYCSIFPEDYLLKRKKLIRLWVAEGLVQTTSSNRVLEEEAEYYLAQLVDRSMLLVAERNEFARPKAFRMHDVVREVTLEISKKMRFCMILEGSQSILDDQTRRLSIQTNVQSLDSYKSLSLSRLRSLIVFSNCWNFSLCYLGFKMLRVLELEKVRISKLPNEVSSLFNLHYLGLRHTGVELLPDNIQKLQNLQTLDLRYSLVKKIQCGVTLLKQLRHLIIEAPECEVEFGESTVVGSVPTREEAGLWKNLQTLKGVRTNEKLVQRLGDMKELRSLKVYVNQVHCPQLCSALTKMTNLRNLYLSPRHEGQLHLEMLNSPPLLPIQKLFLGRRIFGGKMPRFICSWTELARVQLVRSHLNEDPLPLLGQLPKLLVLKLANEAFDGQTLHFKAGWFFNLKRIDLFGLENLNNIVIEEGAMTNLCELLMARLKELKMVPPGIKFLTHLQYIDICSLSKELMEKLNRNDDNEDLQRIRHIPNINIGRVRKLN